MPTGHRMGPCARSAAPIPRVSTRNLVPARSVGLSHRHPRTAVTAPRPPRSERASQAGSAGAARHQRHRDHRRQRDPVRRQHPADPHGALDRRRHPTAAGRTHAPAHVGRPAHRRPIPAGPGPRVIWSSTLGLCQRRWPPTGPRKLGLAKTEALVAVRPQLGRSPCLGAFGEAADRAVAKPLGEQPPVHPAAEPGSWDA